MIIKQGGNEGKGEEKPDHQRAAKGPSCIEAWSLLLKPSQNKKSRLTAPFLIPFLQMSAEKKDSKMVKLEKFLSLLIL
jgi:hypothetical protein